MINAQNSVFQKLYGKPLSDVTQQELFDELYTVVPPEDYTATLKKFADAATHATGYEHELLTEARDAYHKALAAHHESWKEEWAWERAKLIEENDNE
jgi:hypothetical protein